MGSSFNIKSGSIEFKICKRTNAIHGYNGYDAYIVEGDSPCPWHTPKKTAKSYFALLRKLEKVKGVKLR